MHAPSTPRKILLIASSYAPNIGGLERVVADLARGLKERGHSVSIIAPRYPRSLAAHEMINGVPVTRWHFFTPRVHDLLRGRIDLFLAGLVYFPLTLLRLVIYIARNKPDAVNLHFVGAPALFVRLTHSMMRFRLIVTVHGDDVEGITQGNDFDRWVLQTTLANTDEVTACSRYLLNRAIEFAPQIESKGTVIYNGVRAATGGDKSAIDGHPRMIAVGRLVPKKGFDVLLHAMAKLEGPDLILIGDGPERAQLESLVVTLGIRERVKFQGALGNQEALRKIASGYFMVIPSRLEPFGIVAVEAMMLAKPVVATRAGGLPEVLEGGDAILVEPDDPVALAEAISEMSARVEADPTFGMRNRELATRFSAERMIDGYERVYWN